jgi:predicted phage baseplate assembly protein
MSGPWWGRDVDPEAAVIAAETEIAAAAGQLPGLTARESAAIAAELAARRGGFTPDWTSLHPGDPGNALIAVYAEQHAALAAAVDDLPTRARVEHLLAAGVALRPPRPLEAMLVFGVSPNAPGPVLVGEDFEVLGRDASGALIPFETARTLHAQPATLAVLGRRTGGTVAILPLPGPDLAARVAPFGLEPAAGTALYLGLAAAAAPSGQLTLGALLAGRAAPPPRAAGGLFPQPGDEPPRLAWEAWGGSRFVPVEVALDETRAFTRSGVIELILPAGWRAGSPPGTDLAQPLYWIRAQLLEGEWPEAPVLRFLGPNLVLARAGRTVRDEVVETPVIAAGASTAGAGTGAVGTDRPARRVLALGQRPVLAGTLRVTVDEGGGAPAPWIAVTDLSEAGPDDRVVVLDAAAGTLTFGDARTGRGRPLPDGFRHVRASYRAAAGGAEVAAGAISTIAGSAPFLSSVTNLEAAAGGAAAEDLAAALRRGPREIRARGRAVAAADYEVLALGAPGADLRRARAVGGLHPRFPGRALPGVVAVFVVGPARRDGAPPLPGEASLRVVAEHLAAWAPRGAEVVAVAPVFHSVRVEASLELARGAPVTETTRAASLALDRWLDPVIGGDDGEGWPFGGAIRHDALVRSLLREVDGLTAIPRLVLVVDGVRSRRCEDVEIPPHDLLWPAVHELIPLPRRAS